MTFMTLNDDSIRYVTVNKESDSNRKVYSSTKFYVYSHVISTFGKSILKHGITSIRGWIPDCYEVIE